MGQKRFRGEWEMGQGRSKGTGAFAEAPVPFELTASEVESMSGADGSEKTKERQGCQESILTHLASIGKTVGCCRPHFIDQFLPVVLFERHHVWVDEHHRPLVQELHHLDLPA